MFFTRFFSCCSFCVRVCQPVPEVGGGKDATKRIQIPKKTGQISGKILHDLQ